MKSTLCFFALLVLTGCTGIPNGITPVQNFELPRYLGTWHEIARLDHSFERGLEQVTAHYSMRDDGGVRVLNQGFLPEENRWKQAEGKAYFVDDPQTGFLKVSFFGPFYGSYILFELDEDYQRATVCGPNRSYLWFLSRDPSVSQQQKDDFIRKAKALGFDTDSLIFPSADTSADLTSHSPSRF
jgi:apolipoprotein D and lipocalin family protein